MKALILNSGRGSRMGAETKEHPKCMTRLFGEETILSRQLKLLREAGIQDVVITTGYYSDILEAYGNSVCEDMHVEYVHNDRYSETNYIYSIYVAKEHLQDDVILMHGDLVFEKDVLEKLLEQEKSCMVVDSTLVLPEKDFKAVLEDGRIKKVGIAFFENAVAAQPLYKINKKDWLIWLEEIEKFCEVGTDTCYAENAFNKVSGECEICPYDVKGGLCGEIDTMEDRDSILKRMGNERG